MRLRKIGWRRILVGITLLSIFGCNGIAFMQARAMTHFSATGSRTPSIEAMSLPEKAWAVVTGVNVPRPKNTHTPQDIGLQFTTETISFQNGDTLEAWSIRQTEPRGIIILFPAYAESKESELAQAAAFHDMGYSALMVDYRGVGGSSGDDTTLGIREAKDVARAFEYARQSQPSRPIVLYGISMGSAAILRAIADEEVEPDAVVIESPFNRLLDTVNNRFDAMGIPAFPGAELVVFWGGVQQGFDAFTHNPVEYARSVKCPTLLMQGDHDPRVTLPQARSIFDQLGGPKEFVDFPEAGHESLIVATPQMWKEQVRQFLDNILIKP